MTRDAVIRDAVAEDAALARRILVAHDDPALGARLAGTLAARLSGCTVEVTSTFDEALVVTRTRRPDAVIVGARELGVQVVQFLRSLRAIRPEGRPAVAVITRPDAFVVWDLLRAAGADRCFLEPFDTDSLVDNLARLVAPRTWGCLVPAR